MERLTFNLLNPNRYRKQEVPISRKAQKDLDDVRKQVLRHLSRQLNLHKNPGSVPDLYLNTRKREVYRYSRKGKLSCALSRMEWSTLQAILQKQPKSAGELAAITGSKNTNAQYVIIFRLNTKVRKSLKLQKNLVRGCQINPFFSIPNPFGDEVVGI